MSEDRESALDARLRDVTVPAGLPDRVAPAMLFDDAAIDRVLSSVEVPVGLADRVRSRCFASRPGLLDGAAEMAAEPRGGPWDRLAFPAARRIARGLVAIAADLGAAAVALGLVAAMFLAGTALSRRMADPVAARHPVRGERMGHEPVARMPPAESVRGEPTLAVRDGRDAPAPAAGSPGSAAGVDTPAPPGDGSRRGDAVAATSVTMDGGVRGAPDTAGWVEQSRSAARKGMRLVTLPQGGRAVPRSKGFDLVFEMTHGESPFVDPAVNPPLAADRPPLGLRTDAFDALVEQAGRESRLRRGRGGAPRKPAGTTGGDGIAVEELLAALPPPWETATGPRPPAEGQAEPARVAITAVPSLRAEPGSLLVDVCVAPPQPARTAAAADTMIVLDASAEAAAPRSWSGMCRGLARIAGRMRPIDRVSVVVCGPRPRLAALRADAAAIRRLVSELEMELPCSGGDLDAAVRLVSSVARREGPFRDIVIAARADTVARSREDARTAFSFWQDGGEPAATGSSPAEHRMGFVVVDPQEPSPDPALRTGPSGRVAADAVSIGRALLAEFEGSPTLAATACRLGVAFDPKTVGSYRIVGFRQTAAEAVSAGAPAAIDMHVGEWARVVYEVVGRAGAAPGGDSVTAAFEWIPVGGEAPLRQRAGWKLPAARPLPWPRRELPPAGSCELLLAVACGEIAAGSPHAEPRRQSLAAVALVASRWRSRGDVTPLGGLLIEALQRLGMPLEAPQP